LFFKSILSPQLQGRALEPLKFSRTVSLAGKVNYTTSENYYPSPGQSFLVMTSTNPLSGSFSEETAFFVFTSVQEASQITISVTGFVF